MVRPSLTDVMMATAQMWALRSTCRRRAVGAVIADAEGHILSTGYNGVPARSIHCTDVPCPGVSQDSGAGLDMCHAIHAEQNAIAHCRNMQSAHVIYSTTLPCMACMKALLATPIAKIIYCEDYPHSHAKEFWLDNDGVLEQYEPTTPLLAALRLETTLRTAFYKQESYSDRYGDERPKPH